MTKGEVTNGVRQAHDKREVMGDKRGEVVIKGR